jgi:hypothetical protein
VRSKHSLEEANYHFQFTPKSGVTYLETWWYKRLAKKAFEE